MRWSHPGGDLVHIIDTFRRAPLFHVLAFAPIIDLEEGDP